MGGSLLATNIHIGFGEGGRQVKDEFLQAVVLTVGIEVEFCQITGTRSGWSPFVVEDGGLHRHFRRNLEGVDVEGGNGVPIDLLDAVSHSLGIASS